MKNYIILFFAVSAVFSSCKKTCTSGYEGNKCTTETRSKYYGTYTGTLDNGSGNSAASYQIASSTVGIHSIIIEGANSIIIEGILSTANDGTFTIPTQTLSGLQYSGSGTFTGNNLTIHMTVSGLSVTNLIFTGTRP